MTKNKTWKDIAGLLGIGASSSAAYTLRKHYTKHLLAYECHFDRGGVDPQPIINQVEAGSKKKPSKGTASVPSPGQSCLFIFSCIILMMLHCYIIFVFSRVFQFTRFLPCCWIKQCFHGWLWKLSEWLYQQYTRRTCVRVYTSSSETT